MLIELRIVSGAREKLNLAAPDAKTSCAKVVPSGKSLVWQWRGDDKLNSWLDYAVDISAAV